MSKCGILLAFLLAASYQLASGVLAIRRPEKWLETWWTRTREFKRSDRSSRDELRSVRRYGVLAIAIGIFLFVIAAIAAVAEIL